MTKSLELFLTGLIDYAGLFPPAKLPLDEAYPNFVKYKNEKYEWILSKFICPALKLNELEVLLYEVPEQYEKVYSLSILGKSGSDKDEFFENLKSDLDVWKNFRQKNSTVTNSSALEIKIPESIIASGNAEKVYDLIAQCSDDVCEIIDESVRIAFEVTLFDDWKHNTRKAIEAIKKHNLNFNNSVFKLRTGGVTSDAFPEPEKIAFVIRELLDRNIPMKCTAGLHHPVRHYNESVNTKMHGFFNIFGCGVIAYTHNMSHFEMIKMLEDETASNFDFSDDYFEWNGYRITLDEIAAGREEFMLSFGSCSFDEPLEDLRSLNIL